MERSRRKRGRRTRDGKRKSRGESRVNGKLIGRPDNGVWLDFQAAISRGSTFSWLAFVVRSLVSRRPHRCVRLSFLRFRLQVRDSILYVVDVHVRACVDVSARRPHFSTGTCSLNKRTAHALSRFHLDRSNGKNEGTKRHRARQPIGENRWIAGC